MKLLNKIFVLCLFSLCLSNCSNPNEKTGNKRPNIIFIMADDHSYQTLSAYDDRFIQTPNLDRIADEGIRFTNSFVTNSICAPSRAVLLTGKFSHVNGKRNNSDEFDGSQPTFPKYLQQAGYQTALIGKWHLKSEPTGFDYWDILPGQGHYYNPDFITNGKRTKSQGYVTNVITDKSLDWLENRDSDKPFCLLVHHKATHRIWMPDTGLLNTFQGREFDVPDTYFDDYERRIAASEQKMSIAEDMDLVYDLKMLDKEGEIKTKYRGVYANDRYARMDKEQKAAWDAYYRPIIQEFKENRAAMSDKELAQWKYQRYMQDYLKTVKSLDQNVGWLLDYLKENGLYENTLIVYTSDQGFYMGEHGWFDKRFMYEQSMRTPLLMKFPEYIQTRSEVDELVQNIDYAPTLLDLAGVDVPKAMQGKSMLPLVQNENTGWRDALYYHYYEFPNEHMVKRHYGIRTHRYKLIHFYNDIDDWELYDLQEDPMEMTDLYRREGYKAITKTLKTRLTELQVQYGDTVQSTY